MPNAIQNRESEILMAIAKNRSKLTDEEFKIMLKGLIGIKTNFEKRFRIGRKIGLVKSSRITDPHKVINFRMFSLKELDTYAKSLDIKVGSMNKESVLMAIKKKLKEMKVFRDQENLESRFSKSI